MVKSLDEQLHNVGMLIAENKANTLEIAIANALRDLLEYLQQEKQKQNDVSYRHFERSAGLPRG